MVGGAVPASHVWGARATPLSGYVVSVEDAAFAAYNKIEMVLFVSKLTQDHLYFVMRGSLLTHPVLELLISQPDIIIICQHDLEFWLDQFSVDEGMIGGVMISHVALSVADPEGCMLPADATVIRDLIIRIRRLSDEELCLYDRDQFICLDPYQIRDRIVVI